MKTLICASLAYDSLMVFQGRFKDHILPDHVHILNVSFLVPTLRQEFGGCAGNIAYNLALLGGDPLPLATVGDNAGDYLARLDQLGIDRSCILQVPQTFTAQAFITADLDANQITAFHPGAMAFSHLNHVPADKPIALALVGPDGREGMLSHVEELAERGIPVVFDPGQAMPLFDGEDLQYLIGKSRYLALNDYEAKVLAAKVGRSLDELSSGLDALIVTHGAQGSEIRAGGRLMSIPPAPVSRVGDPTGCGDAYRAGVLYGIANGLDWETTGRLASLMGAIKVEHDGAQRHSVQRDAIADRFAAAFSYRPW